MFEFALAVDVGGTGIKAAAVDAQGLICSHVTLSTPAREGAPAVLSRVEEAARLVMEDLGVEWKPVGTGIGIPGTVDAARGAVGLAPNLGWRGLSLGPLLPAGLPRPLYLGNDAALAALGEQWLGAGEGLRNILMVTVGTGIGSGLLLNGRPYRGGSGRGAELGHYKAKPGGSCCACGGKGCLETLTAAPAFLAAARQSIAQGEATALAQVPDLRVEDIMELAGRGDAVAHRIVEEAARELGRALANVTILLDLEAIIIGGGVAQAGAVYLQPLADEVYRQTCPYGGCLAVRPARLGNNAGVIGAAALVWRQEDNALFRGTRHQEVEA